jgi:hypothetical protein
VTCSKPACWQMVVNANHELIKERARERELDRAREREREDWMVRERARDGTMTIERERRRLTGAARALAAGPDMEGDSSDNVGALVVRAGGEVGGSGRGGGRATSLQGLSAVVAQSLHRLRKNLVKSAAAALPCPESP